MNRKIFIIFAAILVALQININAEKNTKGTGELNLDTNPLPKYQTIPKQKLVDNQRLNNYMVEMYKRKQQGIYDYKGSRSGGDVKTLTQKVQEIIDNRDNVVNQNSMSRGSGNGKAIKGMMEVPFADKTSIVCTSAQGISKLRPEGHRGMDIKRYGGDWTIVAAADGVVIENRFHSSWGNTVLISHGNGITTRYAHMKNLSHLKKGDKIKSGDPVGTQGSTGNSTGPHLHFEVQLNGVLQNPANWLPSGFSGPCPA